MTTYEGYNGTAVIDGSVLELRRDGRLAKAAFGKDAAPRRIPLQAITSVSFKPASRLVNGHLALGVNGSEPPTSGIPSQKDAIVFTHKNREAFAQLHAWLLTVVAHNESRGADPSAFSVEGGGASIVERAEARRRAKD